MNAAFDDSATQESLRVSRWLPRRRNVLIATLMVIVAVIGALGFRFGMPAYRQLAMIEAIEGSGGRVYTHRTGPPWLRSWIGVDRMRGFEQVDRVLLEGHPSPFTDDDLAMLADWPALEKLQVIDVPKMTDAGMAHLRGLRGLTTLMLMKTGIRGSGFSHLGGLSRLTSLFVLSDKFGDTGMPHIGKIAGLKTLSLDGCGISDAGVVALSPLLHLERLSVSRTAVSDGGMAHVAGFPSLTSLYLSQTGVGDAGFAALRSLKNLETIWLDRTRVTDVGLASVGDWESASSLRDLNLSGTAVTHVGLDHLRGLTSLSELGLSETRIDDRCIEPLKQLQHLKRLDVRKTEVTNDGVAELKRALPGLQITK